jgi:hypothetical protein
MIATLAILFVNQVAVTSLAVNHNPNKEYDEREYLGSVKDARGKPVYHLVNHTYAVQAAIMAHGHSELLVYDKKWRLIEKYVTNGWDELPILLRRNTLYFKTREGSRVIRNRQTISPAMSPPKCICVLPNNNCYFRQSTYALLQPQPPVAAR